LISRRKIRNPLPTRASLSFQFTFLRGASHAKELVERAIQLDYKALAITDECSLAGVVRASRLQEHQTQTDHRVNSSSTMTCASYCFPLTGSYGNLSELITAAGEAPERRISSLHALTSARTGTLSRLWLPPAEPQPKTPVGLRSVPRPHMDRLELLAARRTGTGSKPCSAWAWQTGLPLTACGDVHMHVRSRRALQDTLSAIRLGVPWPRSAARCCRAASATAPARDAGAHLSTGNCSQKRCASRAVQFFLEELRYEYPKKSFRKTRHRAAPAGTDRSRSGETLPRRRSGTVRTQAEKELELIAELRYEPFSDRSRRRQYARNSRFSARGRLGRQFGVCYALGITEVDPSRTRLCLGDSSPRSATNRPDIDVDFEHERREEVIQYVYGVWPASRALAATVISYRTRSAFRDVGKALGLDLAS